MSDEEEEEDDKTGGVREPLPTKPLAPGDGAEVEERELVEVGAE